MKRSKHRYLALVRHGESEWNALGKWTGWEDVRLTEKGKDEARQVAKVLSKYKFHLVYTSALIRAHQTYEVIQEELDWHHLPAQKEDALNERHYGILTGKIKWEIKKELGEETFKRLRRGWDVPIESGETLKNVYDRVVPHFTSVIHPHLKQGKNVLVVAHGNSIRSLIKHLEDIHHEKIAEVEIATGEVLLYRFDITGKMVGKEKLVMNKEKGKQ